MRSSTKSGTNAPRPRTSGLIVPVPGLGSLLAAVAAEVDKAGMLVIARPARLPLLLPPRECELRREYAAGVDALERDFQDADADAPDFVRA